MPVRLLPPGDEEDRHLVLEAPHLRRARRTAPGAPSRCGTRSRSASARRCSSSWAAYAGGSGAGSTTAYSRARREPTTLRVGAQLDLVDVVVVGGPLRHDALRRRQQPVGIVGGRVGEHDQAAEPAGAQPVELSRIDADLRGPVDEPVVDLARRAPGRRAPGPGRRAPASASRSRRRPPLGSVLVAGDPPARPASRVRAARATAPSAALATAGAPSLRRRQAREAGGRAAQPGGASEQWADRRGRRRRLGSACAGALRRATGSWVGSRRRRVRQQRCDDVRQAGPGRAVSARGSSPGPCSNEAATFAHASDSASRSRLSLLWTHV